MTALRRLTVAGLTRRALALASQAAANGRDRLTLAEADEMDAIVAECVRRGVPEPPGGWVRRSVPPLPSEMN